MIFVTPGGDRPVSMAGKTRVRLVAVLQLVTELAGSGITCLCCCFFCRGCTSAPVVDCGKLRGLDPDL
jgi:hypothetical protein